MRSFRPPRSTALGALQPPLRSSAPSEQVTRPPEPPELREEPSPPSLSMDCTPMLSGLLRGRTPQPGAVAVVCADEMLRERLRRDLEEDGHQVLAADSGPALIPMLVGCTPGVLLVHEAVVDPEPLELCCTVQEDPSLSAFEVVVLSGQASLDARRVFLHAGARDLLLLPYLRSELRGRVGLRLELQQLRLAVQENEEGERAAG